MPFNSKDVDVSKRETLLDGFFTVEKLVLKHRKFEGGWSREVVRFVLQRPDAVCAFVHNTERDTCYFVRQFRPGVMDKDSGWMTEVAAGLIDAGESPEEAINREIEEELGFRVANLQFLRCVYTSPGIISERIYIYHAEVTDADRIAEGGGQDHEDEDIEIVEVPSSALAGYEEILGMTDSKTHIAILNFLLTRP